MKFILYTTSKDYFFEEKCQEIEENLNKTQGRNVTIEVRRVEIKNPEMVIDSDGDTRFSWTWFSKTFPPEDYGVGFHMTERYRNVFGIKSGTKGKVLNGSKNTQNKFYPEFWFISGREKAKGYEKLSEFERLFYHELAHFDEDLDDEFGDTLHQTSVHDFDYRNKKIHLYHYLVDYRYYKIKILIRRIKSLLSLYGNSSNL